VLLRCRHHPQDRRQSVVFELAEQVSGIVWRHAAQNFRRLLVRAILEELELVLRVELLEYVCSQLDVVLDGVDDLLALFMRGSFNEVGDLGGSPEVGGNWTHASPTGTNFFEVQVITNLGVVELSRSLNEDVAASLANGPYTASGGGVFYTGFKLVSTGLPSNAGNYFLHLKDSDTGTTFRAKLAEENSVDQHTADLAARELAVEQREKELETQVVIAEQGRW